MSYTILFILAVVCTSVKGDGDHPHEHEHLHTAEAHTSSGDGGVAQAISSSINNDAPSSQATSLPDLLRSFNIQIPASAGSGGGGYHYPSPPITGNPPPPNFQIPNFQIPPPQGILPKIIPAIIPYFPIVEKVILIVGGGLLLLVFLACLKLAVEKGGFLHAIGTSLANAVSGGGTDMGSIHASVDASGGLSKNADLNLQQQQRVFNGIDRRF